MSRERFASLDLMRGTAALAVLAFHTDQAIVPRAYLAVDFFFLLSGFVLAHAYASRLGTPRLVRRFCLARLIRLYPLYGLATLIGAAAMVVDAAVHGGSDANLTVGRLAGSLATAMLFLPTPARWSAEPSLLYPLVFTAWSLMWELLVNLLYAFSSTPRPRAIWLFIAIGAVGLAVAGSMYGQVGGPTWDRGWTGGARALFGFFAGVAIFRARQSWTAPKVPALALSLVLIAAFATRDAGWVYDYLCTMLLFPLLLWFAADARMSSSVGAIGTFIGYLSYPIYVLQGGIYLWYAPLSTRLLKVAPPEARVMILLAFPMLVVAASFISAKWFDTPARAWLRSRLVPSAPIPGAQTAP